MNTKTETSDLKWTIFSTAKPEVHNPSFTMLSVLLTRTMWWLGIFGFQLFLCYFGYKRVPYTAGNWQNKGRPEWLWDSKYIESRCFDIPHQPWSWSHWQPTVLNTAARKRHICNLISWWVVARVFLPAASVTKTAQLTDVSEGRR